jgi:cytochrome c oxidase subunit 3
MSSSQAGRYYVPDPSHWPILGSVALLSMASGATLWLNAVGAGPYIVAAGFTVLIYMMVGWLVPLAWSKVA